jgi:hypothetical protein
MYLQLPQGWATNWPKNESGVPPLEERRPETLLYAAWLRECGGDTYPEIARALRFRLDGLPGAEESAKKKAIRYVKRGRAYASALGIWPWASWIAGTPSKGQWWIDRRCGDWLALWHLDAVQRGVQQRIIDSALLAQEAVERLQLRVVDQTHRARPRL